MGRSNANRLICRVSVFAWILAGPWWCAAGRAQDNSDEALIQRLARLEQRQAQLETENEQLRQRVARMEAVNVTEVPVEMKSMALAAVSAPQAAQPTTAAEAPPRVQMGAEIRLRPESRSDFSDKNALNNIVLQRIRLNARLRLNERITGLVQLQDSRFWGQEVSTASNEFNVDVHQAYLQVERFLTTPVSLRIGRQELAYGNERLVGAFGWDTVGRAFDGGKLSYSAARSSWDFFFSRVADRRNAGRGSGSQDLIGMYGRVGKSGSRAGLEPYALYLRDGQELRGERAGARPEPVRILTLGFRHFAQFPEGFSYDFENAYQVGQNGPDTHRAAAVAAVARYRASGRFSPEVGFEYDFATGDDDARNGRSGEFNNLFPTNHAHYGYADYMGWRNMQDFKPYFSFQALSNVRTELSYHRFLLVEEKGAWKNAGGKVLGFDPAGRLGTDVGHEIDLTITFPLYEQVRMLGGYSVFIPGRFARATQGPRTSQFGYLQTLIVF
ncbi:MAG: alginate export family protein [Acidobacteria bacterium]|nr:alginate export family protein [Acidobacteriota bacterium]